MLKNVSDITSKEKQAGLNTQDNVLGIDRAHSPDMMNVRVHFDGSIEKRLGTNTQNAVIIADSAGSGFSPTGAITNNIIAFWKLDEPTGNRKDSIGGHTLQDGNNVLQSGGIRNQAALFVAANSQYLLHQNTSTLATGDINFSLSAWIYLNSTSNTIKRTIISKCSIDLGYTPDFTPTMTSNTAPSGEASASTELTGTGREAFKAIDKNINTVWTTNSVPTGFLKYDLGTGLSKITRQYTVTASSVAPEESPLEWAFEGSNDNSAWTILNTQTSQTTWSASEKRTFQFTNTGNFRYHRLNISSSNDATFITIAEWEMMEKISDSNDFEYWLYVNTDNIVTFEVSSSGTINNGRITASSFGALNTATWYNVVAYHDTADLIAVGVNLSMNSGAYASGVRSGSAPFVLGAVSNGASSFFDGRIDETYFAKRILDTTDRSNLYNVGSGNTFQTAFDRKPWASFDFGASGTRWLTVAAGTGIYASSNLGVTWINIASTRTATYQYFDRSKNVLVATSDLYDPPLAWSGSSGTFMITLNSNAPAAKYSVNFQGFLILLNSQLRKRGFFYQDENTQLTGTWASSFDITSSQDDEITAAFIFKKNLYVSTKYLLHRVSYVGGNPDFGFEKVKDWGYVARTVKTLYVEGVGEVVKGLCWDGKTRLFDGNEDQISSDRIEQDNNLCDFALDKLSFSGSGLTVSFAEVDLNDNVYKLCVVMGENSSQTTHMINYDGRAKAFYPYSRQHFNTMTRAESGGRVYVMAFDRSGFCHMLDSGNLDGNTTPIDEHYNLGLIYEKSPAQYHKGHQTNLFFSNTTSGTIYYEDRTNFDNEFKLRESFILSGSDKKYHTHKVIDVPESYNVYEAMISSSSGTGQPWKLQRYDHFFSGKGIGKE